ncbi:MAG: hypothetical protein QNJ68_11455 [Microcoleaceae cyanobacterium MO_207.B10]|nr:hypothetical protein [Microcoleaceae cyanobacterium MO_207.B10]
MENVQFACGNAVECMWKITTKNKNFEVQMAAKYFKISGQFVWTDHTTI